MPNLLVVDDDARVLAFVARALRRSGWSVLEASTAQAALQIAAAERVDLVITDLVMPGGSGWDLADALLNTRPGLPVLLMTGQADVRMPWPEPCWREPLPVLTKPFAITELQEAVDWAWGRLPYCSSLTH